MMARLRTRLRTDDGFSLVELLAAMAIGSLVLTATMSVFIQGVKGTTQIQNRVDSAGRARYAMDRIVRLLDSQVCYVVNPDLGTQTPPVFSGSTGDSVTFYADLKGASSDKPDKYTITYVPKAGSVPGRITIDDYAYNAATKSWSTKVGPTNTLVTDVVRFVDGSGVAQPVFSYYPYVDAASSPPDPAMIGGVAGIPAPTPLTAAMAPKIVKVGVRFGAVSSTSHLADKTRAYVSGSGELATFDADPSTPSGCPS